jgi:phage shock protein E
MYKNILKTVMFIFVALSQPLTAAETIWIDVRSAEEFTQGHLPNAVNIPHTEISEKIAAVTADKKAHIQLYCRSGRRSALAEEQLKALGYENVSNAGGYEQLKNSIVPER